MSEATGFNPVDVPKTLATAAALEAAKEAAPGIFGAGGALEVADSF